MGELPFCTEGKDHPQRIEEVQNQKKKMQSTCSTEEEKITCKNPTFVFILHTWTQRTFYSTEPNKNYINLSKKSTTFLLAETRRKQYGIC